MIPKIIWQTHEWEYDSLPEHLKQVTYTWKLLNPDWQHRYVGSEERAIQVKKFDKRLGIYYSLADKVTQADIWRYVITYQHGGVYADMDSVCTVPLSETIKDGDYQIIATAIEEKGNVNNANFGAVKRSQILKNIIDEINHRYSQVNLESYLYIPLMPMNMSFYVVDWPPVNADRFKRFNNPMPLASEALVLGPDIFSQNVLKNKDKVSFTFNGIIHSNEYKDENWFVV